MTSIHLNHEGHGELTLPDGRAIPITGPGLAQARNVAVAHLVDYAQRAGHPVDAHSSEPSGELTITVYPDGTVEENTNPRPQAPHPAEAASSPHETQSPGTQPMPSIPSDPPPVAGPAADPSVDNAQATLPDSPSGQPDPPSSAAVEQPKQPFAYDSDPQWQAEAALPATEGFKGALNRSFHMTWPPGTAELDKRKAAFTERAQARDAERQEEERFQREQRRLAQEAENRRQIREQERAATAAKLDRLIQTNFQGAQTILVANPKGGARKTTTAYLLGATFGVVRGGSTIAWDANETMGTLGERARKDRHNRTVVNLLEDGAEHLTKIDSSRIGILDAYVRAQGNAHFDVLASDEDPRRQDIIDEAGFATVHDILSRYYRMLIVDTGNNIRARHFVAAQKVAQQLVIPVAASHDSKNRALDMMAAFTVAGHDDLVANAVVLVHELEPIDRDAQGLPIATGGHELTAAEIAEAFEGKVRDVLPIPYDQALKDGGEIDIDVISPETLDAYRHAAASIASSLLDRQTAARDNTPR